MSNTGPTYPPTPPPPRPGGPPGPGRADLYAPRPGGPPPPPPPFPPKPMGPPPGPGRDVIQCGCGRRTGLCEHTWRDANAAPNSDHYRQHRCALPAWHTGEHRCRYLHGHRSDQYARQVVTR